MLEIKIFTETHAEIVENSLFFSMKSSAKKINRDVKILTIASGAIIDLDLKHYLGMIFAVKSMELYFFI